MDLTKYRNKLIGSEDERAVSPVIGVILMVAITVILAAVIAAFVLDIGDLDDSAPNAQFDWGTDGGYIDDVTHTSGDNIDAESININTVADGGGEDEVSGDIEGGTWTAGETIDFTGDITEVTIVWEGDGSSTVIAEYEI
ncbi:type IV pilin [Natronorubrum sulfidifaciens]|uniref:Archaeal Type IV pilin N-terminal domain-containing protein n=1 Tax=Natronorubrum sulfidifaciens JCM 14089 TaxID=1230460 RepID=L9VZC4_9EURY|nr:type IV pilin N-terminal domain-containing protein [Natronorubrum sulfidifaciens]ELY42559.1 hypothetical protein C495_14637 [Natronorubrum sulfidifaciens JCM 14089]